MLGRAFTGMAGVLLLSRSFWAAVVLLAGLGYVRDNPQILSLILAGIVVLAVVLAALIFRDYRQGQRLMVRGQLVPVSAFECPECGTLGQLRVHPGTMPVVVHCRRCLHVETVHGAV